MITLPRLAGTLMLCLLLASVADAQPGRGRGFRGGMDERHDEDRDVFHFLLTHHQKITRSVKELPNGVETLTESNDPEVSEKIKEHVEWMK
jgi:hypothetical protein